VNGPLTSVRLRVVRVAIALGWISVAVVVAGALLDPGPAALPFPEAIWALAAGAGIGNLVLARLPWARLVGRSSGEAVLQAWSVGLVVLVAALTYAGGGWRSDFYLLAFLVIPFIALTEPRRRQIGLYALLLLAYLAAVLLQPPVPAGALAARLGVLAGASVLAAVVAQILVDNATARARAESEARMERLLADEAHHRIKNNLQLVSDLLTLEAGTGSCLDDVVSETLARIGSVAAVHQALARRGEGRVTLRPVLERVVGLLAGRLGPGRTVRVEGDDAELPADRATWTALVVNELVTNALRHGRGAVAVHLACSDAGLELRVGDEGEGPSGSPAGAQGGGLGTALVDRLVTEGMQGRVERSRTAAGYEVAVTLPYEEVTPAASRRRRG
jgi:two-component sensor histidine kinase